MQESGTDLAAQKMKGKRKRGAIDAHPGFVLCTITCSNGAEYVAKCGVRGSLFGVNQRLLEEPSLLNSDPLGSGHVAVVQLKQNFGEFFFVVDQLNCD